MADYKIVASDLDGTLLNDDSKVSEENFKAIKTLCDKGVFFVPSSGRCYSEIPDELKADENIRYYITSNGAVVYDKLTGDRIQTCMSKSDLKTILDIIYGYEVHITYRYNGECYVDINQYNEEAYEYYNVWICHKRVVEEFAIPVESFKDKTYSLDGIEVMSLFFHSESDRLECKKRLCELGILAVVEACENNIEIANINAGKGNALYKLCDKLGIAYTETIAVGDSDNDSSIVKAAGLGLAVSNARNSLKDIADKVICSNEQHSIAYIVDNFLN